MRCRADVIPINAKPDTMLTTPSAMSSCIIEKPAWVFTCLRRFRESVRTSIRVLAVILLRGELKAWQNFPRCLVQRPCRLGNAVKLRLVAGPAQGAPLNVLPMVTPNGNAFPKTFLRNHEGFGLLFEKAGGQESRNRPLRLRCRTPQCSRTTKRLGDLRLPRRIYFCWDFDGGSNSSLSDRILSVFASCIVSSEGL